MFSKLCGTILHNYYPLIIASLTFLSLILSRKIPELLPLRKIQPTTAVAVRPLRSSWWSLWNILQATARSSSLSTPRLHFPVARGSLAKTHTRWTKTKLSRENMVLVQFSCCVFKSTMQQSSQKKKQSSSEHRRLILNLELSTSVRPFQSSSRLPVLDKTPINMLFGRTIHLTIWFYSYFRD